MKIFSFPYQLYVTPPLHTPPAFPPPSLVDLRQSPHPLTLSSHPSNLSQHLFQMPPLLEQSLKKWGGVSKWLSLCRFSRTAAALPRAPARVLCASRCYSNNDLPSSLAKVKSEIPKGDLVWAAKRKMFSLHLQLHFSQFVIHLIPFVKHTKTTFKEKRKTF